MPARDVMMEAMVESALRSAKIAEEYGLRPRPDYSFGKSERRARPDRCVHCARGAVRLSTAPGTDRSGDGFEGAGCIDGRTGAAAARRNWRHDPREPDAETERRSDRGSLGGAADSAVAGNSQLYAAGDELPWMRADDEHVFPGTGGADSELSARRRCRSGRRSIRAWKS